MGVRLLIGEYDGTTTAAAMVDSASGWMIGPVWEADDAPEQIEGFLDWLRRLQFMSKSEDIGLDRHELPAIGHDGDDPRQWPDKGLEKLVAYWRRTFTGDDGLLKAVEA